MSSVPNGSSERDRPIARAIQPEQSQPDDGLVEGPRLLLAYGRAARARAAAESETTANEAAAKGES